VDSCAQQGVPQKRVSVAVPSLAEGLKNTSEHVVGLLE
jgi:hypothetical protein